MSCGLRLLVTGFAFVPDGVGLSIFSRAASSAFRVPRESPIAMNPDDMPFPIVENPVFKPFPTISNPVPSSDPRVKKPDSSPWPTVSNPVVSPPCIVENPVLSPESIVENPTSRPDPIVPNPESRDPDKVDKDPPMVEKPVLRLPESAVTPDPTALMF